MAISAKDIILESGLSIEDYVLSNVNLVNQLKYAGIEILPFTVTSDVVGDGSYKDVAISAVGDAVRAKNAPYIEDSVIHIPSTTTYHCMIVYSLNFNNTVAPTGRKLVYAQLYYRVEGSEDEWAAWAAQRNRFAITEDMGTGDICGFSVIHNCISGSNLEYKLTFNGSDITLKDNSNGFIIMYPQNTA